MQFLFPFSPLNRCKLSSPRQLEDIPPTLLPSWPKKAPRAGGPGFSGPEHARSSHCGLCPSRDAAVLPAWRYPHLPPALSHARLLWVSQLQQPGRGWSLFASPADRMSLWETEGKVLGQSLCPSYSPFPCIPRLCLLFTRRGRNLKGWRRLCYPFLNKHLLFLPLLSFLQRCY